MTEDDGMWLKNMLASHVDRFSELAEFLLVLEPSWELGDMGGEDGEWMVLQVI